MQLLGMSRVDAAAWVHAAAWHDNRNDTAGLTMPNKDIDAYSRQQLLHAAAHNCSPDQPLQLVPDATGQLQHGIAT
eukprot:1157229-Pelagomonas_calceolata.AAC.4